MALPTTACFLPTFLCLVGSMILVNCKGGPSFTRKKIRVNYSASVGSSVRLRCPVSGTDDPAENRTLVMWSHDSRFIDNTLQNYSRFRLRAGKHLKIVDVGFQDAGMYTCKAYNEFGSVAINITLTIRKRKGQIIKAKGEPPKFKMNSKSLLTFKKGETAKLRCHSTGNPDPDVQWYKNDESYDKNSKRAGVSPSGWTLNLRYLTTQDTGKYMCRVSNTLGTISRTFVVKVKVRIPKPQIEEGESSKISISQGKNAIMECQAESAGAPEFQWRRWGNDFNSSVNLQLSDGGGSKYVFHKIKTNEMDHNLFGSLLVILNVTKADEGKYSCFVKNKYGSDEIAKYLYVIKQSTPALTRTSAAPSSEKFRATESRIPVILVVGLTVSTAGTIIFLIILICCCRKQRKELEKKFVINYAPEAIICAEQDMQKSQDGSVKIPRDGTNTTNKLLSNPEQPQGKLSSESPTYCLGNNCEDKRQYIRTPSTDIIHELNVVDSSRTSSERTLSIHTMGSRELFIDKDKCHSTCGEICRYKGQTNTSGKTNPHVRESVV